MLSGFQWVDKEKPIQCLSNNCAPISTTLNPSAWESPANYSTSWAPSLLTYSTPHNTHACLETRRYNWVCLYLRNLTLLPFSKGIGLLFMLLFFPIRDTSMYRLICYLNWTLFKFHALVRIKAVQLNFKIHWKYLNMMVFILFITET